MHGKDYAVLDQSDCRRQYTEARENKRMKPDVLIVGAGPTGLTLANVLIRHGVKVRVVEREPGPTAQSRANLVHIRTLEYWDKLGLAQRAITEGIKLKDVKVFTRGKHTATFPLVGNEQKDLTPFPFALGYPQGKAQRLLVDGLTGFGAKIAWGTELVSLSQNADEVQAVVRHEDGTEQIIAADWLIGADGAKSRVRHSLDMGFEGGTYEQIGFLADVEMEAAFEEEAFHLNLSQNGFVGITPQTPNQFRLFGAMSPRLAAKVGADEEPNLHLSDLQQWFDQYFHVRHHLTSLKWVALYRIHRRVVEHYRSGRCFLAGDAAHIHSPFGGQGMNLGIGDAYNLGWKLALVIGQQAHPHLLESYEAERRPIALRVLKGTDRSFDFEVSKHPLIQQFNVHLLPTVVRVATRFSSVRRLVSQLLSQLWIRYPESPAVMDALPRKTPGPKAGERAPYGVFEQQPSDLYELFKDTRHHLLLFEGLQATNQRGEQDLTKLAAEYQVAIGVHLIRKEERTLYERFQAEKANMFLIRPDGHIAYRGSAENLSSLREYLDQFFLKAENQATFAHQSATGGK